MAKQMPCQRCLNVADADYFLTNRLDNPWLFDQATVALCFQCLMETTAQMGEAYAQALAWMAENPEPGVLESIETDEGPQPAAEEVPRPRGKAKAAAEPVRVASEVTEAAATADD
jgi:hypothetical protein